MKKMEKTPGGTPGRTSKSKRVSLQAGMRVQSQKLSGAMWVEV
jgi:hypothetical protein